MKLTIPNVTATGVLWSAPTGWADDGIEQPIEKLAFTLSGTFVATVIVEISEDDGVTWLSVGIENRLTLTTTATVTAAGAYLANVQGATHARLRCSVFTSGAVQVGAATMVRGS